MALPFNIASINNSNSRIVGIYKSTTNDAVYLFFWRYLTTTSYEIRCYKSTATGTSWSEVDSANRPSSSGTTVAAFSLRCCRSVKNGQNVYIVDFPFVDNLYYHHFSMATDTWVTKHEVVQSFSGKGIPATFGCDIAYRGVTGSEIVVAAMGVSDTVMGADYNRVDYWRKDVAGSTWTGPTSLDAATGTDSEISPHCITGKNNIVHFTWLEAPATVAPAATGTILAGRSLSTTNVLGTQRTINPAAITTIERAYRFTAPEQVVSTGTNSSRLIIPLRGTGNGSVVVYASVPVSVMGTFVEVTASTPYVASYDGVLQDSSAILYRIGTQNFSTVGYRKSTDKGGTWQTFSTVGSTVEGSGLQTTRMYSQIFVTAGSGNEVLAIGHGSPTVSSLYYNEYVIRVGATPPTSVKSKEANHLHVTDKVTVRQRHKPKTKETTSLHVADRVKTTQRVSVKSKDSIHTHVADKVATSQTTPVRVKDSSHLHIADNAKARGYATVRIKDTAHAQSADRVSVAQNSVISVKDSAHVNAADRLSLSQSHSVRVGDAAHLHVADKISTQSGSTLVAIKDATHAHASERPRAFSPPVSVSAKDNAHLHVSDSARAQPALWPLIDEKGYNDSDYIRSPLNPTTAQYYEAGIKTVTDPQSSAAHDLVIRARKSGAGTINADVYIYQGVTQIGGFNTGSLTTSFATYKGSLSGAQADTITNYGNLRVRVVPNLVSGSARLEVSWFEFNVPYPAAGTVSVTIESAAHLQVSDRVGVSQANSVKIEDATHLHVSDKATISQVHAAKISDSDHAHVVDSVAVSQNHFVRIEDATHVQSADNVSASTVYGLAISDASHQHVSESVSVSQKHAVSISDATHAHSVDRVALSSGQSIRIKDSTHVHASDSASVSGRHLVRMEDSYHLQVARNVSVSAKHRVKVEDSTHLNATDKIRITVGAITRVAGSYHQHVVDSVAVRQASTVRIASAAHEATADRTRVSQRHIQRSKDSFILHVADRVGVSVGSIQRISDATHQHVSDSASVSQIHNLKIADSRHIHVVVNVNAFGSSVVFISEADSLHVADAVSVSQNHFVRLSGSTHQSFSDKVAISEQQPFRALGKDAAHDQSVERAKLLQNHVISAKYAYHAIVSDDASVLPRIPYVSSPYRTMSVEAENRIMAVKADNRLLPVPDDGRSYKIKGHGL